MNITDSKIQYLNEELDICKIFIDIEKLNKPKQTTNNQITSSCTLGILKNRIAIVMLIIWSFICIS